MNGAPPPGCTLYTWAINIYSPSGVSPWHCYILVRYSKPEQLDEYTKAVELHLLHQAMRAAVPLLEVPP